MVVFVLTALLLGGSRVAQAHDVLVSSTPAPGSAVTSGPSRVDLVFNEPVDPGADDSTVTGPDGSSRWETGATTAAGATVSVALRPLGPAGSYTVGYHIVSDDGRPVPGTVTFRLTTAGPGTPALAEPGSPPPAATPVPASVWIGGAVVLLVAGALVAWRIAR